MKKQITLVKREGRLLLIEVAEGVVTSIHVVPKNKVVNGNIYIGKVKSVVPNIQGAFIEVEEQTKCFLPLKQLEHCILLNRAYDGSLKQSDEVLVQVVKEPMKTKDATVTTNLSFQGRYSVVTSGDRRIVYSKKLGKDVKAHYQPIVEELREDYMGILVRTNAKTVMDSPELPEELERLKKRYEHILKIKDTRQGGTCLERALPAHLQAVRDYLGEECEVRTDQEVIYKEMVDYCTSEEALRPYVEQIQLYKDSYSLSKLISLETILENALRKVVWLKSGGSIVIEHTEALTAIDVNTSKSTSKKNQEETIYAMNQEAAIMVMYQLRLRNISGIVIVDFINMKEEHRVHKLIALLREEARKDSVATTIVGMTNLGLMEITRKKVLPSLREQLQE